MPDDTTANPKPISQEVDNKAPTLTIDWDLYGEYLEDANLSDDEKREFIKALWSIVVSFVDLGFGIHPAQLATKDSCEQVPKIALENQPAMVSCNPSRKTNLNARKDMARVHLEQGRLSD